MRSNENLQALLGRNRADDAASQLSGSGFHLAVFGEFLDCPFHDLAAFLQVSHLTSLEDDRNLDLVLLFQELLGPFHLEVDVMGIGLGSQANFFQLDVVGALRRFLLAIVLVLAVIHDSADGRFFGRCNLHEIQAEFSCFFQSFFGSNNSQLGSVISNDSYGADSNLFIDPGWIPVDGLIPFLLQY